MILISIFNKNFLYAPFLYCNTQGPQDGLVAAKSEVMEKKELSSDSILYSFIIALL